MPAVKWCDYCDDGGPYTAAVLVDADRTDPNAGDHVVKRACSEHINKMKRDRFGTPFSMIVFHPLSAIRRAQEAAVADGWCDTCGGGTCHQPELHYA